MKIYFDQFLESFGKMGIGMASIIIVIGVLIISVMLLNLFTSKKIKTSRKIIFVSALLVVVIGVSLLNGIRIEQEKEEERIRIEKEVKEYVENNEAKIVAFFEENVGIGGLESTVEVDGRNFVITFKDEYAKEMTDEEKAGIQEMFNGYEPYFEDMLKQIQTDISELNGFEFRVCDKNGNIIISVEADGK